VAVGGEVNHIIWPDGTFTYPGPGGAQIEVSSTSANDTVGGSGIQRIEIHYLDMNLDQKSLFVDLNGLTPVTTDVNGDPLPVFRFFQCVHAHALGTFGGGAAGTISINDSTTAALYALIKPGDVRCASSARMVPAGKRAIVSGLVGGSVSISADARTLVRVAATELDVHQYTDQGLFIPFGSVGVQNNSLAYTLPMPLAFREGTIIAMTCSPQKAATITGDWFGHIEDV